ncbi:MAG: hypothetical protein Sapg2KO_31580 [Saprospiraceae bacterium]
MFDFLSKGKGLIGITVVYLIFAAFLLPFYAQKMNKAAKQENSAVKKADLKPLDLRFQYSKTDVDDFFKAIGPKGEEYYKFIESKIDMAYPIVYALFFMSLITFLFRKNKWDSGLVQWLSLLPLLAAIPDYFENFNILKMLEHGASDALAAKGSLFTQIKWVGVLLCLLTILVLAFRLLIIRIKPIKN